MHSGTHANQIRWAYTIVDELAESDPDYAMRSSLSKRVRGKVAPFIHRSPINETQRHTTFEFHLKSFFLVGSGTSAYGRDA
jgi:hypothetical protein